MIFTMRESSASFDLLIYIQFCFSACNTFKKKFEKGHQQTITDIKTCRMSYQKDDGLSKNV